MIFRIHYQTAAAIPHVYSALYVAPDDMNFALCGTFTMRKGEFDLFQNALLSTNANSYTTSFDFVGAVERESPVRPERAAPSESTEWQERAVQEERTNVQERADLGDNTVKVERAVAKENTVGAERAVKPERTDVIERAV